MFNLKRKYKKRPHQIVVKVSQTTPVANKAEVIPVLTTLLYSYSPLKGKRNEIYDYYNFYSPAGQLITIVPLNFS